MLLAHRSRHIHTILVTSIQAPEYTSQKNAAKFEGELSLEANAKLNILKYDPIHDCIFSDTNTTFFTGNSADYGGAVYVDDDTISGTCAIVTQNQNASFQ